MNSAPILFAALVALGATTTAWFTTEFWWQLPVDGVCSAVSVWCVWTAWNVVRKEHPP